MNKLPYELTERKLIYKHKFKFGKPNKKSAEELLNYGIINLDKPRGPKSIHCGNKIRSLLEQPKVGHAGTLDPLVTGVLPIGVGRGVKVLPVISKAGKVYEGIMHLHHEVSREALEDAVKKFTGKIEQLPPRISAVARKLRTREIYWFTVQKVEGQNVWFEVGCEAGTYIRKLCHDMGEYLKVGGHMAELRRIQAGPFKINDSIKIEEIRKDYKKYIDTKKESYIHKFILPPETAVEHLPKVYIDVGVIDRIKHGSPVFAPGVMAYTSDLQKESVTAIFDINKNLVAIGISQLSAAEMEKAEKGMAIKTDVVLI
jgi:H/ACA ribonucleoprotein complex subunit 4